MWEELDDELQIRNESPTVKIEITDTKIVDIDCLNDACKETISVNTGGWVDVKEIKSDQVEHFYRYERIEREEYNNSIMYSSDAAMRKNISECNEIAKVTNLKDSTYIHLGEKRTTPNDNFEDAKNEDLLIYDQIGTHTEEKPLACTKCKHKSSLVKYELTHNKEKPFECTECGYKTVRKEDLLNHKRTHTGEKPSECTECGFKTEPKADMLVAYLAYLDKRNQPAVAYECADCGFKTAHREYFILHLRKHTEKKLFECTKCDYKTVHKTDLVKHKRSHTGPFECKDCGLKTASKTDLVKHKRSHTGPFECKKCDFKTVHKGNLARHRRTHIIEKPFKCTECGFKTGEKGNLVKHKRIHVGWKPFECTECGLKTASKTDLENHKRTHTGEKPFECTECGFKTALKGSLVRHRRTHIAQQLFVCTECDFNTKQRAKWFIHKQIHTKAKSSDFVEYNNLEGSIQNSVILIDDDSLDVLEIEDGTEEVKLDISESQFLLDNKLVCMNNIKTEPM